MQKNTAKLLVLTPLFLVLIIDTIGMGIIFPILSPLFMNTAAGILSPTSSLLIREFFYGLTLSIFFIAMFFGAPFFGDLSDRLGRKKVLLICLFGTGLGLLLSAISIQIGSVALLICGRILNGFTAGSQAIAQAAIADISTTENKANNISLIILANCLGFIMGPIFGGYFADSHFVTWFNFATPFFVAAMLAFINMIGLLFTLQETYVVRNDKPIQIFKGLLVFIDAFSHKKIRFLNIILSFLQVGWALYFSYISLFLIRAYHYQNIQIGHFMAFFGLLWGIALSVVIRIANRFFTLKSIVVIAAFLTSAGAAITVFENESITWLAGIPVGVGAALSYAGLAAIFSNIVDKDSQGWIMGIVGAIVAVAWGVAALLAGFVGLSNIYLPFIISAVLSFIGGALLCFYEVTTK